ncbi:MAG TPA: type II toxin-antitoxin system RelE/ParE family toxin [Verrucomicrobiae bacterium]
MTIEYHPTVQRELKDIRDWYNEKVPGLGGRFVDEFERQTLQIAAAPIRWMTISGELHRALMLRFPYVIYFRQIQNDRIRITIVKHQRRHPAYGRKRL